MSIEIDITKELPGFTLDVQVKTGNTVLGLLGASGCGKSLTMRCIAGIETPDEGKIVVDGVTYFDRARGKRPQVNLSAQERKCAPLFQNYMLFPHLTVAKNIGAGIDRKMHSAQAINQIIRDEVVRFSLEGLEHAFPAALSGGQQQRVALARMLAARPQILMLDEPFSALDSHLKAELEQELLEVFDEFTGTVLYVSHDIDEALRLCDEIAVYQNGRVVEYGQAQALTSHPTSLAGAKLSGMKNIIPVIAHDEHTLNLADWDERFVTEEPIDPKHPPTHLGIRAFQLEQRASAGKNTYRVRVKRVLPARFETLIVLELLGKPDALLYWRLDHHTLKAHKHICAGDELFIEMPSERVSLMYS